MICFWKYRKINIEKKWNLLFQKFSWYFFDFFFMAHLNLRQVLTWMESYMFEISVSLHKYTWNYQEARTPRENTILDKDLTMLASKWTISVPMTEEVFAGGNLKLLNLDKNQTLSTYSCRYAKKWRDSFKYDDINFFLSEIPKITI